MADLLRKQRRVPLAKGNILGRNWASVESAVASVVADTRVVDDRYVVNIRVVDDGRVHTSYCRVVVEVVVSPIAALVSPAGIAVAVVHSSIKTSVRSPVARMPCVTVLIVAPVARGPE